MSRAAEVEYLEMAMRLGRNRKGRIVFELERALGNARIVEGVVRVDTADKFLKQQLTSGRVALYNIECRGQTREQPEIRRD
jgi:hypothetical protein